MILRIPQKSQGALPVGLPVLHTKSMTDSLVYVRTVNLTEPCNHVLRLADPPVRTYGMLPLVPI